MGGAQGRLGAAHWLGVPWVTLSSVSARAWGGSWGEAGVRTPLPTVPACPGATSQALASTQLPRGRESSGKGVTWPHGAVTNTHLETLANLESPLAIFMLNVHFSCLDH